MQNAAIIKKEHWRGVVDANYNSAELCIKGLLKLKIIEIPSTHGGVAQEFGLHYIKTGMLAKDYGRIINKSLRLRNLARYDCYAEITEAEIKEVDELTKKLIEFLAQEIKKIEND